MSRIRAQSPALVVAIVALVAALAGTAIGGVAVTALNKQERKQVKRIAKKQGKRQGKRQARRQINEREPTLDVRSARAAAAANGVRPVKVNFRSSAFSGPATLLSAGSALVEGECDQFGRTKLTLTSTANNSSRSFRWMNGNNSPSLIADHDSDAGDSASAITESGATAKSVEVSLQHVGPGGTGVSGDLQLHQDTDVAQCVISGVLFVA